MIQIKKSIKKVQKYAKVIYLEFFFPPFFLINLQSSRGLNTSPVSKYRPKSHETFAYERGKNAVTLCSIQK